MHGVEIGDVELERVGPVAARDDCLRRGLDLLAGARGERHVRAGLRQRRCRGETDAASAAGDERTFAVETEGGRFGEIDHHAPMSCTAMPARQSLVGGTREEKQVAVGVLDDEGLGPPGLLPQRLKEGSHWHPYATVVEKFKKAP